MLDLPSIIDRVESGLREALRVFARRVAHLRLALNGGRISTRYGADLFVSPRDDRALELMRCRGAVDVATTTVWRMLVESLSPTVVVDVGANYGEIIMSTRYDPSTRILAFEPNPVVSPYLRLTMSQLEDRHDVALHEVALSDGPRRLGLRIDTTWSGRSQLTSIGDISNGEVIEVPVGTLDEYVAVSSSDSLLAKIDVEGHEAKVLVGGARTFATCHRVAIVCEVEHLTGTDLDWVLSSYDLYAIRIDDGALVHLGDDQDHLSLRRDAGTVWARDVVLVPPGQRLLSDTAPVD